MAIIIKIPSRLG